MTEDIELLETIGVSILVTFIYPTIWAWHRAADLAEALDFEDRSLN